MKRVCWMLCDHALLGQSVELGGESVQWVGEEQARFPHGLLPTETRPSTARAFEAGLAAGIRCAESSVAEVGADREAISLPQTHSCESSGHRSAQQTTINGHHGGSCWSAAQFRLSTATLTSSRLLNANPRQPRVHLPSRPVTSELDIPAFLVQSSDDATDLGGWQW